MQITLHQAAEQVRELLDQVDPETGELPAELEQARGIVATKAQAVAAYVLEADKQADAVETYVKELTARVKASRKRAQWLKQYLAQHMAACGVTEIRDERGIFKATLAVGRDEAIEVFDEKQIPADYLREIPAKHEPDKTVIKKAIKDGFDVPGARLVKRDRLTVA